MEGSILYIKSKVGYDKLNLYNTYPKALRENQK